MVYCCHLCNSYKGDHWNPSGAERVLHPLNDDATNHVATNADATLSGITQTGIFHIELLHLNRAPLTAYRTRRIALSQNNATIAKLSAEMVAVHDLLQQVLKQIPGRKPE